jgi:PAS domain-containing protein
MPPPSKAYGWPQPSDALSCAVVLTNEHGTILHANRSAERMLRTGEPIQRAHGILQSRAPSAASELRSVLALARVCREYRTPRSAKALNISNLDFAYVVFLRSSNPYLLHSCPT